MNAWNHRVIKTKDGTEDWYGIHEVYYDENEKVDGWSVRPVPVSGNSIQDLRKTLEQMLACLDKEVIDDKE